MKSTPPKPPSFRPAARRELLVALACLLGANHPLRAQDTRTLAEVTRWLETDGTDMAVSSSDTTPLNVRMVSLTSRARLTVEECRLTIVVTDNSGVSGMRTTMVVPLATVDTAAITTVARPTGYHDFIYIPGKYFLVITAQDPATYPFRTTTTTRPESKSYLATIPVKNTEAADLVSAAIRRASALCSSRPNP